MIEIKIYCRQCDSDIEVDSYCNWDYCQRRLKHFVEHKKPLTSDGLEAAGSAIEARWNKYLKEPKQMTREEAKRLIKTDCHVGVLELLEALGLIKFDEDKIETIYSRCGIHKTSIQALDRQGYQIIKKDTKS